MLNDSALQAAHVGISVYEPASGKWWYDYQGEKYFVPASNVKLATCYAAMKYLGDSLVGLRYKIGTWNDGVETDMAILAEPTGDPSFLHPDFKEQKVYALLKSLSYEIRFLRPLFGHNYYGQGWSWDDSREPYMPQLSFFPIYGNVARFEFKEGQLTSVVPSYFQKRNAVFMAGTAAAPSATRFINKNVFEIEQTPDKVAASPTVEIPLVLADESIPDDLIADTLHKIVKRAYSDILLFRPEVSDSEIFANRYSDLITVHSQPTDSVLKPMMHRSDNFFAEQSLLMVGNELIGYMNDEKIIDTLIKTDFKDLPQKPKWVDGSGLSRYNLFTPQDFVVIIQKMQTEFGMTRLKNILPTGNQGTFVNYYKADSTAFYAKTGSLSGVVALSGFLTTKKGKELIFSVLVNNHQASATRIRRAVEKFIQNLRNKY